MTRWQTLCAIDFDRWAAETYRANFPGVDVRCASVADEIDRLPDADVILGGPPCQPHSFAGKRQASADKRDCGPDFAAAIARKRPRAFLMENVAGLMSSEDGKYAQRLLAELEASGYVVQIKILDAVSFGVPQFRVRCWWWGVRRDLYVSGIRHCWPKPTHAWPPPGGCMFGGELLPGVTAGQALGLDLHSEPCRIDGASGWSGQRIISGAEPSPAITGEGTNPEFIRLQSHADPAQTIHRPAPTLRSEGGGHDGCRLELQIDTKQQRTCRSVGEPSPTVAHDSRHFIKYRWSDAMLQKHPPASPASPAPTVQAKYYKGGAEGLLHWKQTADGLWVRRLTPLECGRLQSVPDDFIWPDGIRKTPMYKVIGNGWASRMGAVFSDAFAESDPDSHTLIDLFCGGGLGAVGWHGKFWSYESSPPPILRPEGVTETHSMEGVTHV